jgi:hypothetical protein
MALLATPSFTGEPVMKQDRKDGRNPKLSLALQRRLEAANHEHRLSLDALRDAVYEYLDDLRAVGLNRDQALESVRSFVAAAMDGDGDGKRSAKTGAGPDVRLITLITDWCVERWDTTENRL